MYTHRIPRVLTERSVGQLGALLEAFARSYRINVTPLLHAQSSCKAPSFIYTMLPVSDLLLPSLSIYSGGAQQLVPTVKSNVYCRRVVSGVRPVA